MTQRKENDDPALQLINNFQEADFFFFSFFHSKELTRTLLIGNQFVRSFVSYAHHVVSSSPLYCDTFCIYNTTVSLDGLVSFFYLKIKEGIIF